MLPEIIIVDISEFDPLVLLPLLLMLLLFPEVNMPAPNRPLGLEISKGDFFAFKQFVNASEKTR
jgi:hypothetical protein